MHSWSTNHFSLLGAEIWEEDDRIKFPFLESGDSVIAGTSSVNCLFCRIPHQRLHSPNTWTPFSAKALFFMIFASSHPLPKTPFQSVCNSVWTNGKLTSSRAPEEKDFPFFLWGDPVQNRLQNPAPAGCLFSTRKSRSEVPERGDFGEENCLGKGGVDWGKKQKKRKKGCTKERLVSVVTFCHPAIDPSTFPVKPALKSRCRGRFGRFCSFSTVFGQFRSKTATIDSKSAPLKGLLRVLGWAGEGVCGCKSGHKCFSRVLSPNLPAPSAWCTSVKTLVATIHFSPFTCSFRRFLRPSFTGFFATRTPNSQNHSYVHYPPPREGRN